MQASCGAPVVSNSAASAIHTSGDGTREHAPVLNRTQVLGMVLPEPPK